MAEQESTKASGDQQANANDEAEPVAGSGLPKWHHNWEIRAAIAGAVITVVGGGVVSAAIALTDRASNHSETPQGGTVATPTSNTGGTGGFVSEVMVNEGARGLTVSGTVDPGIRAIIVLVGPRADQGRQFWASQIAVSSEGPWSLQVDTPPSLPNPYKVVAFFEGNRSDIGIPNQFDVTDPNGTYVVEPGGCLELRGPACFLSAGLPATYEAVLPPP